MRDFLTFIGLSIPITCVVVGTVAIKEKINHKKNKTSSKGSTNTVHQYKRFDNNNHSVTLEQIFKPIRPITYYKIDSKPKVKIKK